MDFSSLLSSGSLLYVIGGGVCVVLVLVLIVVKLFSPKQAPAGSVSDIVAVSTPTVETASQTVAKEENVLPSTEVIDAAPVVVSTNAATPAIEVSKGEIPPLSSWKPSQEAAAIKSEEADTAPTSIEESVQTAQS